MVNPRTPTRPRRIWRAWPQELRPCCPAGPSLQRPSQRPAPCRARWRLLAPRGRSSPCSWPVAGSPAAICPPALLLRAPRFGRCWSPWAATPPCTTLPCRSPCRKGPTAWFWPRMGRSRAGCRRISPATSRGASPTPPGGRSRLRSSTRTRSFPRSRATVRGRSACRSLRPRVGMCATTSPPPCIRAGFQGRILPAIGLHPDIPALIAAAITRGVPVCAGACRWQVAAGPR